MKEVARLLPELKVSAGTDATEGREFPTIEVGDSHGILFRVMPENDQSRIHSVRTTRRELYRGKGRIGSLYSSVFGITVSDDCHPGMEELYDKLICRAPGSKAIFLIFRDFDGTNHPPVSMFRKMRVTEVFWSANPGN